MSSAARPPGLKRAGMIDMESNTTLVQQFPAHEAVPGDGDGPFPCVVLLHDIFGLDSRTRAFANRLARAGYYAVAPNLYAVPFSTAAGAPDWMGASYRLAGSPEFAGLSIQTSFTPQQYEDAKARAEGLTDVRAVDLVRSALAHLAAVPEAATSAVAVVGFGMGGRLAFLAACEFAGDIHAGVVFSGEGIAAPYRLRPAEHVPILRFESLRAPLLFFYGAQDDEIRAGERDAIERILASSSRPHELVTFPEAGHDFFNEESPDFRLSAARQAWDKMLDFLSAHLARPAP